MERVPGCLAHRALQFRPGVRGAWVEQQGTPLSVFEARRSQSFWRNLRSYIPTWDAMIGEFNQRVAKQKK